MAVNYRVTAMEQPTATASSDHSERFEQQIRRAAESDDVEALRNLIIAARAKRRLDDNVLGIALGRSSEKGKIKATQHLLDEGAPPDGAPGHSTRSPLHRAVERGQAAVVPLLLKHGANPNAKDKRGTTVLMTAAWKNQYQVLSLLLARGADVNARDNRGRNVLNSLAANKTYDWGHEIIELVLNQSIAIDG